MVTRIGLGVFEACFGPGIPLYLCKSIVHKYFISFHLISKCFLRVDAAYFYTKRELGKRLAYYQSFGIVASAFSGLIAFGIQNAHVRIPNWKLMFIIEVSFPCHFQYHT